MYCHQDAFFAMTRWPTGDQGSEKMAFVIKRKNDEQLTKNLHRDVQQFSEIPIKAEGSHPSFCVGWHSHSYFSVQMIFTAVWVYRDVRYNSVKLYLYSNFNNSPFRKAALDTVNQWSRPKFLISKKQTLLRQNEKKTWEETLRFKRHPTMSWGTTDGRCKIIIWI